MDHRFCVAPMMDWTDRHCRAFHRTLTRRARLYTEMVTADAVIHGDRERLLGFDPVEHPVGLQLGGNQPEKLARAARIGAERGYDEVNLNVGCPSDRVGDGGFGACLMREPARVGECLSAMAEGGAPVTLKCRIGVDEQDPAEALWAMAEASAAAGVRTVVVHARKAWLQGLSPKENREVPPLDYPLVHRLKREWPALTVVVNGGIATLDEAQAQFDAGVDGVMLGRAAYHDPMLLGAVDGRLFGEGDVVDPFEAVERFRPYIAARLGEGVRFAAMSRHMLGLFAGRPGARRWRRVMTEDAVRPGAGLEVLDRALEAVRAAPALAA